MKEKKITKAEEKAELQKLRRKCLYLWIAEVKRKANGKCEYCSTSEKRRNAHHIEGYTLNKDLRYDPRNGVHLCTTCHKFGRFSAHKSFVFMYLLMTGKRKRDLQYLIEKSHVSIPQTKELLLETIKNLTPETRLILIKRVK